MIRILVYLKSCGTRCVHSSDSFTGQKMKFSIKYLLNKWDQIRKNIFWAVLDVFRHWINQFYVKKPCTKEYKTTLSEGSLTVVPLRITFSKIFQPLYSLRLPLKFIFLQVYGDKKTGKRQIITYSSFLKVSVHMQPFYLECQISIINCSKKCEVTYQKYPVIRTVPRAPS